MAVKVLSANLQIIQTTLEDDDAIVTQHWTTDGRLIMQGRQEKAKAPLAPQLRVADNLDRGVPEVPQAQAAPAPAVTDLRKVRDKKPAVEKK